MLRKLNFFGHSRKSRKSRGRSRRGWKIQRSVPLGIESLEERCMLSAAPVLSSPAGQFFPQNTQFTVSDLAAPLRATFIDVVDQVDVDSSTLQSYVASIDWGDG